jgi:hypothetical protein
MEAEPEHLAYTALLSPDRSRPDALAVIDLDPGSDLRLDAETDRPAEHLATSCTTSAGTPAARRCRR